MTPDEKAQLLDDARSHVAAVQRDLRVHRADAQAELERFLKKPDANFASYKTVKNLFNLKRQRVEDLATLEPSPYFARCDVRASAAEPLQSWYFGKRSFPERGIFSWISPAASLRFADPGAARYRLHDGSEKAVALGRKDSYLIADGIIRYMATEDVGQPRQLVHQEHFTGRKAGFVLPEIVAQMERAQDQVIRAEWKGPFAIAGPAGSGKTTLALHRLAYLAQSPETASRFAPESCVVFVQDRSTKEYFSGLLPELGIHGVKIMTLAEWATGLLGLPVDSFVSRYGHDAASRDRYEFAKRRALAAATADDVQRISAEIARHASKPFACLDAAYRAYGFGADAASLFAKQWVDGVFDRFDLALLLHAMRHRQGRITEQVEYYDRGRNGTLLKKRQAVGLAYSLAVLDEIQNWLPEEVELVRGCVDPETAAVTFVGDLAQQTRIGTARDWNEIGGRLPEDRHVTLAKVYRNPRPVLEYLRRRGYDVAIPEGAKDGPEVREMVCASWKEAADAIVTASHVVLERRGEGPEGDEAISLAGETTGILVRHPEEKARLAEVLGELPEHVHLLTVAEAQGTEFDCVVVIETSAFATAPLHNDPALKEECGRIDRDMLYVALTRAMEELTVVQLAVQ